MIDYNSRYHNVPFGNQTGLVEKKQLSTISHPYLFLSFFIYDVPIKSTSYSICFPFKFKPQFYHVYRFLMIFIGDFPGSPCLTPCLTPLISTPPRTCRSSLGRSSALADRSNGPCGPSPQSRCPAIPKRLREGREGPAAPTRAWRAIRAMASAMATEGLAGFVLGTDPTWRGTNKSH